MEIELWVLIYIQERTKWHKYPTTRSHILHRDQMMEKPLVLSQSGWANEFSCTILVHSIIAFIADTHCHCAIGLHDDIWKEAVQRDRLSIHILLENMISNLQFFVKGRVNELHE